MMAMTEGAHRHMELSASSKEFSDDFDQAHAYRMLDYYSKYLVEQGYRCEPYPDVDARLGSRKIATPHFDTLNHALWMCEQCRLFLRAGRLAKAYRWIGTIQGILLMNGVFSIMELKDHNRVEFPPKSNR
jgi:hypothetical protein